MNLEKNQKKSQAATDFLITYGWALGILLLVIVIIFQSGFFQSNQINKNECVTYSMFFCLGAQYKDSNTLLIALTSTSQTSLNVKSISIVGEYEQYEIFKYSSSTGKKVMLDKTTNFTLSSTSPNGYDLPEINGKIIINYTYIGGSEIRSVEGNIHAYKVSN